MSFQRCKARDKFTVTERKITDQGYMVAPGKLARTGIQMYFADELGLDLEGYGKDKQVRLYRPPEEVMNPEALQSFEGVPITLDHPDDPVTCTTWKDVAVGDVCGIKGGGNTMDGTLIIRDESAIKEVIDGKTELSMGYDFDLDLTPGTTADGQEYDGVQRNIRGNHAAIVDYARGGPQLRIADRKPTGANARKDGGQSTMATKKVVVDGFTLEMEDATAAIVERIASDATSKVKHANDALVLVTKRAEDAEAAVKTAKAENEKMVTDHAAATKKLTDDAAKAAKDSADEIAKLKAQVPTAEKIEAMVSDRAKVVGDATKVFPAIKPVGKTLAAIRLESLTHALSLKDSEVQKLTTAALGGVALEKATEEQQVTAFNVAVAASGEAAAEGTETTVGDGSDESVSDTARALVGDGRAASTKLTGRALFLYRSAHGGLAPGEKAAQ